MLRALLVVFLFLNFSFEAEGQAMSAVGAERTSAPVWRFAVSGDSRNCGDVVMPAIAAKVRQEGAAFYWHLGDYRAIYDFDEDYHQANPKAAIIDYEAGAWPDFIQQQLVPFGDLPVYLALGNHETIPPKTRADAVQQFADWFDTPELRAQRLKDDAKNHLLTPYYHRIKDGIDFISLDNSSADQFDGPQLTWIRKIIDSDAANPDIKTLVVGMHEAFPDSLSAGHSMNDSPQETQSGRAIYGQLVNLRARTHKNVYLLASHSHFYLADVFNTTCRQAHPESILPGWIVGTAGAVRYRLPAGIAQSATALADTYGYLMGSVFSDGKITFEFKAVADSDVPSATSAKYGDSFVKWCFEKNMSTYQPQGPSCQ